MVSVESQAVTAARKLRAPPIVLGRLLAVLRDPKHSARDLAKLVEIDPAVAARALRLVNSAALRGAGRQVGSIHQAIVLLGEREILRLLLTVAADALRVEVVPGYGMGHDLLWERSVRSAIGAEVLARRNSRVDWSEAYTAALLMDVGKLALGQFMTAHVSQLQEQAATEPEEGFDGAERTLLGIDHAELGSRIAQDWGLPGPVIIAIRFHHRPDQATEHPELCAVVHLADVLAGMASGADSADGLAYPVRSETFANMNLDEAAIAELLVSIDEEYRAVMEQLRGEG